MTLSIDNVLFDLDGTLLDTAPTLVFVLNQLLDENGIQPVDSTKMIPLVSDGARRMIQHAFMLQDGSNELDNLHKLFIERYDRHLSHLTEPFPNTRKVLKTLHESDIRWGVVTNKWERHALPLLDIFGFRELSACVVCGDTTDKQKPHPKPILHALQQMEASAKHTLYIGDAEKDIAAGRAAGTKTMVAKFGYIPPHDNPSNWGADHIIDDIEDLISILHHHNKTNA